MAATSSTFLLLAVLTTYTALQATGQLLQVCINSGLSTRVLTGYVHIVEVASNATLVVNQTPVSGLAVQTPPFRAGYKLAISRPITETPIYSPTGIGMLEGSISYVEPEAALLIGDIKLSNETGYVTIQGRLNTFTNVFPVTGGVGENYYSLGNATFTLHSTYAGGANAVLFMKAIYYGVQLC